MIKAILLTYFILFKEVSRMYANQNLYFAFRPTMSSNIGNGSSAGGQNGRIVTLARPELQPPPGYPGLPQLQAQPRIVTQKGVGGTIKFITVPTSSNIFGNPRSDPRLQNGVDPEWKVAVSSLQNETKELKSGLESVKKSVEDLKNLVMSQNQEKPQKDQKSQTGPKENANNKSANVKDGSCENLFTFEEPSLKRVKFEDQSEEIQRLKEDNLAHLKEIEKLNQIVNDLKKDAQKQTQTIKNLKADNLKLGKENIELKYGGQ